MGFFFCSECGVRIEYTPKGYATGCEHYPLEGRKKIHAEPKLKERESRKYPWPVEEYTNHE